jgi:hypothetical protein
VKTLRLSATLAALILTASTACAAVVDFGNALGPSGGYTTQAYYQARLGGQPMTAAQQAYADQEDELRQLGFRAELGGDFALGQMFYHMAYGVTPPASAADSVGGQTGLGRSSDGLAGGSSGASAADGFSSGSDDVSITMTIPPDLGGWSVVAVPEPSTWAMMVVGFAALVYAGWRGPTRLALRLRRSA